MIYMYLYFRQTVHHHNSVNIVLFHKSPEVRLCRRQWHLCDDEFIPSFVSLKYEVHVHVFITDFTEAVEDFSYAISIQRCNYTCLTCIVLCSSLNPDYLTHKLEVRHNLSIPMFSPKSLMKLSLASGARTSESRALVPEITVENNAYNASL